MSDKKPKAIDVNKIDLKRLKDSTTDLPSLIEYAHSVGGFAIVPTDEGAIKGKAMAAMESQTQEQMDMIMEQMKVLAKQAQAIKDRVEISHEIYHAKMNFEPSILQTYYLYQKEDGSKVLSMIGPKEWKTGKGYQKYLATVKLNADSTWKVLERAEDLD